MCVKELQTSDKMSVALASSLQKCSVQHGHICAVYVSRSPDDDGVKGNEEKVRSDNQMACFAIIPADAYILVLEQERDARMMEDMLPIVMLAAQVRPSAVLLGLGNAEA